MDEIVGAGAVVGGLSGVGWIDVSVPLHGGMVHWPANPPVTIEPARAIARGDRANVSAVSLASHAGTHMDAPRHIVDDAPGIDTLPFDATIGRARVIAVAAATAVGLDDLRPHGIEQGERILLKTHNSDRLWVDAPFNEDFVYISHEAARFLAERGVRAVGVDYLSVGGYHHDAAETHQALLGAGVWVIEGLDLSAVAPGVYDLICLPLKIRGGDGAPARAILKPVSIG